MTRPPAVLEWILRRVVSPPSVAESVIGDLREEFAAHLRRGSRLRAHLRYLQNVFSIFLHFLGPSPPAAPSPSRKTSSRRRTMRAMGYDLRQALRVLTRKPGLTLVVVVSLGLGIGANTAIFSLVRTILLKPLPYPEAQELVEAFRIDERVTGLNPTAEGVSGIWAVPYQVHRDWLASARVFQAGGGFAGTRVRLRNGEVSTSLPALRMTSGAFQALGVAPVLGRTFLPEEDQVGAAPLAVLSHGLWQTHFGGDPGLLGQQIHLDGVAHTVVGVMPPTFGFPSDTYRLWISLTDAQKASTVRNSGYLRVVARLSPGVTLEEARQDMERVARQNGEIHPEEAEHGVGLFPLKDMILGGDGDGLWVLWGAVILVLLIACTNVAGIFLVRATERRRETGVRRALGADVRRLAFQQMGECLILSVLGGLLGWGLAVVGMEPVLALMPRELPRIGEMTVDTGLLFTAMGFALLTGVLTGLLPTLKATRIPITAVLQEGGRSLSGSRSRNRTQTTLVVSQIALAFVLLTGASLVIRSMSSLLSVEPGFDARGLALVDISFPSEAETLDEASLHFRELEERIRALPGVVDVGAADQMPFAGSHSAPPVTLETREGEVDRILHMPTVTPDYFPTMGIRLLAGRLLSREDTEGTEPVVVVSQALAQRMAPDGSPLGLRVRLNVPGDSIWRRVVGVVSDVKYRLSWSPMQAAYVPFGQDHTYLDHWIIRTAGDPMALGPPFRQIREEMDPEGTHYYRAMDQEIRGSVEVVSARFSVLLLAGLAALAAFLALFGIYGVLAYLVQMNARVIGVQLALGAEHRQVMKSILGRGMFMALVGLGVGIPLALALGRGMESQLFGVEPWDLRALGASATLLLMAALGASWIPGRRAAGLDPVEVLKRE